MQKDFFPQNISYLLDNKQLTVKTILQITGNSSPGLISMWKSGERQITTKDLVEIANYLNYTVDDLINTDISMKENRTSDELDILFDKTKSYLNESEKAIIKTILIEKRKEIDKQNGEDN